MAITLSRTRELLYFAQLRNCLPYAYGGSFSRDTSISTDCSGLVFSAAALLTGLNPYQRYGSTETLRLARLNRVAAPCGLLPANDRNSIPANASLRVGVMHGGGGPDSHTACSFQTDGVWHNFESRGDPGVLLDRCSGNYARSWADGLFTDFWYLPAVTGGDDPNWFPLPDGYYYGPADGPNESIAGVSGEPQVWLDRFKLWQAKAGATPDGKYGPSTETAARKIQNAHGLPATGTVDRKTWELVMGVPPKVDALTPAEQHELLDGIRWLKDQFGPMLPGWKPQADLGKNPDGSPRYVREAIAALVKKNQA